MQCWQRHIRLLILMLIMLVASNRSSPRPSGPAVSTSRHPAALAQSAAIAQRSTFSLDELRYEYPEELAPPGETPLAYLTRLTWSGAARR